MSYDSVALGELINHKKGFAFKTSDYRDDGVPVIRVSNFTDNGIENIDLKYVSQVIAEQNKSVELKENDIVIATVGSWATNPNSVVGKTILVPSWANGALMNQNCVILRSKNNSLIDQLYIFYYMKQQIFKDLIVSKSQGSANQASITLESIFSCPILIPKESIRRAVVTVLSSIDKKIDLLKETNKTLESIAQAIFKSWFIDFDPVHAKQQGVECAGIDKATSDLFPDSFVESELGLIPKDWGYGTLGEIADFQNGYAFNSKQWTNDGNQVLKIGNVKPGIVEYEGCSFVSNETTEGLERFKLHRGDLLVGMTGYVGETGLVYKNNKSAYLNQRVGKISPKQGTKSRSYIYCCVRNKGYKQYAETLAQGSAQANISGKDLLSYPIVIPNKRCIDLFETNIYPIIDKILNNVETSKDLAAIRDTLLPRLISGKLDLSNIEEQLEGVA